MVWPFLNKNKSWEYSGRKCRPYLDLHVGYTILTESKISDTVLIHRNITVTTCLYYFDGISLRESHPNQDILLIIA